MKKILTITILAIMALSTTGCDSFLDCNKSIDSPDYIEAYLYLPGILSTYSGIYYDVRVTAPLSQMMGTSSYTSFASNYYVPSNDDGAVMWRNVYWEQGMNLENMIKEAKDDKQWTLTGIGYAIKAFSWDLLTKYHGELPMKEAFEEGRLSFDYDYQKDIYTQVRAWADTAIVYLSKEDNSDYGSKLKNGDLIFEGDADKWIKFAHGIIVCNLASLTNKKNFKSEYAQQLLDHAELALQNNDDNVTVKTLGGGKNAQFTSYNNFWGSYRGNLSYSYFPSDYAVQIMTGTVPEYDKATGDKVDSDPDPVTGEESKYRPWDLNPNQIICDTLTSVEGYEGHFDPRVLAKLGTYDDHDYRFLNIKDEAERLDSIEKMRFYGSGFTSATGPIGTATSFYGRSYISKTAYEGTGRWIYRDDAPYILMTAAEIKFDVAETYWKLEQKVNAFNAWKEGVSLDEEFTRSYLQPGNYDGSTYGSRPGGDKINKDDFKTLADSYLAGPYVGGMTLDKFTLSHIMMQKWIALYPWGAHEAWVDMRKYQYDIKHTGDYPGYGNGWTETTIDQKWDDDETKVYKGFYLYPAQVENRRGQYNINNAGSPCFRIRPRYNSEYMWNIPALESLKPIAGTADNYHCSMPWFSYPGDQPESL